MVRLRSIVLVGFTLLGLPAWATPAPAPVLPPRLAGWAGVGLSIETRAPWGLAKDQAAAMQEFGLRSVQRVTLLQNGRRVPLEALLFGDASGSFGAFTYLRPAGAERMVLADRAAAAFAAGQTWFYRDHWLLHLSATPALRADELNAIAAALPAVHGGSHSLPLLLQYLPREHFTPGSVVYAEGPAGLDRAAPWLAQGAAGFDMDAEIVVGSYRLGGSTGQLAIVSYPTPQIARDRLNVLSASIGSGASATAAATMLRRSGSLLAIWHGPRSPAAEGLLAAVQDRTVVTWTRPPGLEALPSLILGIFALAGIIIAICLGIGLATGGLRVALAHLFPRRFALYSDSRFIRLNLR